MTTLYERLGGRPAIDAAVEIFYKKMLADNRVNYFFENTDMKKQIGKQKGFLTMVFGGHNNYTGKDMREAHKHLVAKGLNDTHFNIVVEHLGNTLKELGVPESDVAEVATIANSVRNEVLNKQI